MTALDSKLAAGGYQLKEPAAVYNAPKDEAELRQTIAALLQGEVAAMNPDNFVVRVRRRLAAILFT